MADGFPTSSRQTSCYLITAGAEALVLDAGSGLGALHINPALLDGVETVTLLLSHFHLDHVTGLGFVSARGLGGRELTIAGPGCAVLRPAHPHRSWRISFSPRRFRRTRLWRRRIGRSWVGTL